MARSLSRIPGFEQTKAIIVRIDPEIHRRVAMKAAAGRKSMNKYGQSLLEKATEDFAAEP